MKYKATSCLLIAVIFFATSCTFFKGKTLSELTTVGTELLELTTLLTKASIKQYPELKAQFEDIKAQAKAFVDGQVDVEAFHSSIKSFFDKLGMVFDDKKLAATFAFKSVHESAEAELQAKQNFISVTTLISILIIVAQLVAKIMANYTGGGLKELIGLFIDGIGDGLG